MSQKSPAPTHLKAYSITPVSITSGEEYRGKKCVVLGSNNSAHDICADLWEHDADVTMIQRSSTLVARSDTLMELAAAPLYSEAAVKAGITTDKADLMFASVPYKIMHTFQIPIYEQMAERDAEFYERLTKAGFLLDFGEDGSGLFMKYLRRGSGYYIDVGASELIAEGKIKLKSGVSIERINEYSVVLSDGTELPADLIVYATGYGSMNGWAAKLISQEVADKVGKCWGLGSGTTKDPGPWEGELRNMWKPTQQPALWFHGGNLHQSRHYSQFWLCRSRPVWKEFRLQCMAWAKYTTSNRRRATASEISSSAHFCNRGRWPRWDVIGDAEPGRSWRGKLQQR